MLQPRNWLKLEQKLKLSNSSFFERIYCAEVKVQNSQKEEFGFGFLVVSDFV